MIVYIDNLDWRSFFWLFFQNEFKKIYFFDKTKALSFLKTLLKIRGIEIEEVFFSIRSLKTSKGKYVYLESYEKNVEYSFKLAEKIISNSYLLNELNNKYGNNTIKLYFSKLLQTNLFYWTFRICTAKALIDSKNFSLYIKAPNFIDKKYISELFPEMDLIFYNSFINQRFSFIIEITKDLYTNFSNSLINLFFNKNTKSYNLNNNVSVLSIQEESIRLDQSLRNQLHWVDLEKSNRKFSIHIISLNNKNPMVVENQKQLNKKNIFVNKSGIFRYSRKKFKQNSNIMEIRKWISTLYLEILKNGLDIKSFYLAKTIFFLNRTIDVASTCMLLNVKVYLIKESYLHYSDAIQLLSKKIGVKTITYQYSNLGLRSPLMMSSSDVYLSFSKAYTSLNKYNSLGPMKIKPIGYTNQGIENKIRSRIKKLENHLEQLKVDFVITFFDEANSKSEKWAMIHEDNYRDNIKLLSKKIINDEKIAVIIKTQFIINKVSKLFKNEPIILKAIKTGRLIEIFAGKKRNDVYPFEVASCSDICINHKLGATAALESIAINKRCLLIDPYNYKTVHDKIYNKKNIIYPSLSKALDAIDTYRNDCIYSISNDLGDWSEIKSYFLEETEPKGIFAINFEVEKGLKNCL
tara:strand:+ start:8851 stop:10752 length:1902 start_codon:yes stop_codon:yes gene_type:complete